MSQSDMWRWADEQGEQRLVVAEELRTAIANGVLPPSTLVWRDGMAAWVPASSVPEFANIFSAGEESRTAEKPPAGTNPAAVGPARATLQGIQAREMREAVAAREAKELPNEKRTPSVAPPRPNAGSVKPPAARAARPNVGPAIPPAPRLPSEAAPKAAVAPKAVAARAPVAAPAKAAPAPRPPSTTNIDKDWGINDDETTNVPGKNASAADRPAPPVEAPSPLETTQALTPQAKPSQGSGSRVAPPPSSPRGERRQTEETTESTTFQFEKNSLSLRLVKPPVAAKKDESEDDTGGSTEVMNGSLRNEAPPALMESYGKPAARLKKRATDEAPPTAPSPDLEVLTDDGIPKYAQQTIRLEGGGLPAPQGGLPAPPKVREPTATTMLPIEFQQDEPAEEAPKPTHEVSRTIRFAADFLGKVLNPARAQKTAPIDMNDPSVRGALLQMKPPPLPPSLPPSQVPLGQGVGPGPNATTSPALRNVAGQGDAPPQLPLNALLVSGGMLVTMVVGAFFVGRCSVKPEALNAPTARAGLGNAARFVQDNLPPPPKPCWVLKQPARWASVVSKNVPFDLRVLASGKIAIGYAKSDDEAVGIEVTPTTSKVDNTFAETAKSDIARVTPLEKGFYVSTEEPPGSLKSLFPVVGDKPFYLGISDKHLAAADQPSGVASQIWPISEDDVSGPIRSYSLGNLGFLTALRAGSSRQRKVFAGLIGPDRKPVGSLVNVAGSGGLAGEPMVGSNGREVAVVFADQANEQSAWKLRIGHAPLGKIPASTTAFDAPPNGPGGDANYPSIAGLPDGRWVLVWTEGSSSSKTVRAQTFAPNFTAIGDPLFISPPASYFGSSMVGVVGNAVTVVFVLKGRSNNELWGSVLQCG